MRFVLWIDVLKSGSGDDNPLLLLNAYVFWTK